MKNKLLIFGIILSFFFIFSCSKESIDEKFDTAAFKTNIDTNKKITGCDEWGFNWQARQFNGYLINMMFGDHYFADFPHYKQFVYDGEGEPFWNMIVSNYQYFPYLMPAELLDTHLIANWNSGIVSKEGDYPPTWVDSNGWIEFKYSGKEGNKRWSHFRKLVASKSTDVLSDGIWYNQNGQEIGKESMFFPELIVIQVINNGDIPPFFYDEYKTPWGPGYGKYKGN